MKTLKILIFVITFQLFSQVDCEPILSGEETNFDCTKGDCGNWEFVRTSYSFDDTNQSPSGGNAYSVLGVNYPGTSDGSLVYNLTGLTPGVGYTVWFDHLSYTNDNGNHIGYWKLNDDLIFGKKTVTNLTQREWIRSAYSFVPENTEFELKFDAIKTLGEFSLYLLLDNVFVGRSATCSPSDCESYSSFNPTTNKTYVLSAWVKEEVSTPVVTYSNAQLQVLNDDQELITASASGDIIDGWQQIQEVFTIPSTANELEIKFMNTTSNNVYFDDIRIHPLDGSMKSFVYDPMTQRLMAELDENNYATFYEYDQEGGLVRVKKETVDGVYTIQETRSGTSKINTN